MLIYNVAALLKSDEEKERPEPQRIASVEWSRDGLQAVLYLDGTAQALYDFAGAVRILPDGLSELSRRAGRTVAEDDATRGRMRRCSGSSRLSTPEISLSARQVQLHEDIRASVRCRLDQLRWQMPKAKRLIEVNCVGQL